MKGVFIEAVHGDTYKKIPRKQWGSDNTFSDAAFVGAEGVLLRLLCQLRKKKDLQKLSLVGQPTRRKPNMDRIFAQKLNNEDDTVLFSVAPRSIESI